MNRSAEIGLLRSAAGSLILKLFAAGAGVLSGVLLARLLGPAEFGKYAIAMAAANVLATVAVVGLPALVTRESAIFLIREEWSGLKGLLVTSHRWVVTISGALIVIGIMLPVVGLTGDSVGPMLWSMSLCLIPLLAVNQLRAAFLRGLGRIITADIPDLLLRPLILVLALSAVYSLALPIDSGQAVMMQVATVTLAGIVGSLLLVARLPGQVRRTTGHSHSGWLRDSRTFLAITLAGMLEAHVPLFFLGYLADAESAGLYQAAAQVVSVVALGLVAINLPLQPKLAALHAEGDLASAQRVVTEAARLGSTLAVATSIVVIPFASVVMGLFGEAYVEAANVLRILVVAQLINAISGGCGVVLAMTGHQAAMLRGSSAALACNCLLCLVAIPSLGLVGAALGVTVSLLVWNSYFIYFAWKKIGLVTALR